MLGINPGGDPATHESETVESHTDAVLNSLPADWSAYRDESWRGFPKGTARLQKRVLHVLSALRLNPGGVPSSNVVFVRSRRLEDIEHQFEALADSCWNFHAAVIEKLKPCAVVCFGRRAGRYVCRKTGAHTLYAEVVEENSRGWRNQIFVNRAGLRVVIATHPSIVDWKAKATDPTSLIQRAME